MCLRRLRAVPTCQRVKIGITDRADRCAHQRYVAATIAVLFERVAQIIELLPGQVRRASHAGVTGHPMTGRAQTQSTGLRQRRRRALGMGRKGGDQEKRRDR